MSDLSRIPPPSDRAVAIRVLPAAERAIRQGHPWLFADSVTRLSHNGRSGDTAVLFDRKNRLLAVGLYDPDSPLRVRILVHGHAAKLDSDWFAYKLQQAQEVRAPLLLTHTSGYRLVHGENDGFGGLVIDRYGDRAVIKLYSLAWIPHLTAVIQPLKQLLPLRSILLRLSRNIQKEAEDRFGLQDGMTIWGTAVAQPVPFLENGLRFEADIINGQKTGFFLDQRENRQQVELFSKQKRVLNVFAYSGGFSIYALRGGAKQVTSLDLSKPALEMSERHVLLNQFDPAKHDCLVGDAFEQLAQLQKQMREFDMVIIDPPSFAKQQSEVERALGAYGRLVELGVKLVRPDGLFVMASCSSRIGAETFFERVHNAAWRVGRPLTEIKQTGHPLDHPITFKEAAYLKCLFATA